MAQASSKRKSSFKKKKPVKKQKKDSKRKRDALKKAMEKEKYFHCNFDGHWRRNYPSYMKGLKKKKNEPSSEGMLVIESNLAISSTSSWILDSGSSA